jgi:hypothetical protein
MSAEKYDLDLQSDLADARQEGYKKAESKYQKQLSIKEERIRQLEEEIRRLRGE